MSHFCQLENAGNPLLESKYSDDNPVPTLKQASLKGGVSGLLGYLFSAQEGMGIYVKLTINNGHESKYFVKWMILGLCIVVREKWCFLGP